MVGEALTFINANPNVIWNVIFSNVNNEIASISNRVRSSIRFVIVV